MCRDGFATPVIGGLALLLTVVCVSAMPARASADSWTPFGPGGGRMISVAASSRGDLYAVTAFGDLGEVWQLPANSTTWRWRNSGLGTPRVTALAVHPTQPDSLWAVTGGPAAAIFRSSDAGASWQRVAAAPTILPIAHLDVVPLRGSVALFAQGSDLLPPYLLRSADGGLTWSEVPGAWGPVAAASDRPGLVYAANASPPGLDPGLVRSTDGGRTFARVAIGLHHNDELQAVHVTRGRKPLVFASFSGGLYRSTDGVRFERVGFSNGGPPVLGSDPRDSGRIYAADGAGFYTSTRAGRKGSFRKTQDVLPVGALPEPTAMVVGAMGPVLLAGGDLYDSRLQTLAETGIMSHGAAEVAVAEQSPSELATRIYFECMPSCDLRTYLSHNAGATFSADAFQLPPLIWVTDLAYDPAFALRRLETNALGTFLWQPIPNATGLPYPVDTVAIAAGESLLAGGAQGVQRREGEVAPWHTTLSNAGAGGSLRAIDLRVDVGAPDGVVALALETAPGAPPPPPKLVAFRSLDAGEHWSPVLPALAGLLDVEPVPGSPTSLFALFAVAGGSELRRSDDGGVTSVPLHTFTTAEAVSDFALDAVAHGILYAPSSTGLLRSEDGGATWESTPGTLDAWGSYRNRLQHVWVHPTERGHVFAAPADGGLFENRLSD